MFKSLLFILTIVLGSCSTPGSQELSTQYLLDEEFELSFGESMEFSSENISVTFSELLEDSRCPSDVTCVWAGNGVIQIEINSQSIQLNTIGNDSFPDAALIDGYEIKLIQLLPVPHSEKPINREDYYVRLIITKN